MQSKLGKLVLRKLNAQNFRNEDQAYLFTVLWLGVCFAALMHVMLLVFFAVLQSRGMVILNVMSLVIYLLALFFVSQKSPQIAGLVVSLEVMIYSAISTYLLGTTAYAFLYLIVIITMQMVVPYTNKVIRWVVAALCWALLAIEFRFSFVLIPVFYLGELEHGLGLLSLQVTCLGVVGIIWASNSVKDFISRNRRRQLEQYESQAHTDELTGLYNRRFAELVFDELGRDVTERPWCVGILDIDNFKQINDTYGHNTGDRVLVNVSNTMTRMLRQTDVVVRWGGEEFLVLLSGVQLKRAYLIMEKLRIILAETFVEAEDDAKQVYVTVTVGVATLDKQNPLASIADCDRKLYVGKRTKNVVVA